MLFSQSRLRSWKTLIAAMALMGIAPDSCVVTAQEGVADAQLASSLPAKRPWTPELVQAVELAGANREEIQQLLDTVPDEHWESAEFLVTNMPERDLKSLTASFLKKEIALAHQAIEQAPWGKNIPKEIFLNNILPYANINERRDSWREDFRERFAPLIAEATSPGHAAALLNQRLFPLVQVKYSTQRGKADQSPYESMSSGLASCTGLSVLLIDACRALAIPARFVGTPLWSDKSGNHSWIEVWDDGWHFTGAAEPSGNQLDQAWFVGRASTALRDDPKHAIYAVSFRKTPIRFPLVWDRSIDYISAVNVTDRYTGLGFQPPEGTHMISFRVLDPKSQSRVHASVRVLDEQGIVVLEGASKDERFDANDHLHQYLKEGQSYSVELKADSVTWSDRFRVEAKPQLLTWVIPTAKPTSGEPASEMDKNREASPVSDLVEYLQIAPADRLPISQQSFASMPLTKEQAHEAEGLLLTEYRTRTIESRRSEMEAREISLNDLKMPFTYTVYGEMPAHGRSLYISMHGGGGAPPKVNDRQWENQKKLYQLEEGVYVAPRAPTDTWNLWHQAHIDAMFDRLIENLVLLEGVNSDRVFLMGYSAGGDGVYQLAPRMADRFAAAAMMAGHPNETSPLGLRNLPFTIHMGEKDAAYNRNQTARDWQAKLEELQKSDPDGYLHWVKLHEGKGHWMERQDAEALPWMHRFTRNRYPKRVVWKQDDVVHERFYWLSVDRPNLPDRALVIAEVEGQTIRIEHCDPESIHVLLRDDWIDMSKEITILCDGEVLVQQRVPRTIAAMESSLLQRGDPKGIYWGTLQVPLPGREKNASPSSGN
jgi:predicted esterase